jgi:hypothetical protein
VAQPIESGPWHENAIPKECLKAAKALDAPHFQDFYLAGGTALALRYGHRLSVDLDFFSEKKNLDFAERQSLLAILIRLRAAIEEEKDGTVHARLGKTHLSFFRYSYPLLRPVRLWRGFRIADPFDIGLKKLSAVMTRGSRKDFIDLYAMAKQGIGIDDLLRESVKKFPHVLDFNLQACRALVYFQEADREPSPRLRMKASWDAIKTYFQLEVRRLSRRLE